MAEEIKMTSDELDKAKLPTEKELQMEDKKTRIREMRARYGEYICPFCKAYTKKYNTCGWRFSEVMPRKVIAALKSRDVVLGKTQCCGMFSENQEAVINRQKKIKYGFIKNKERHI